MIAGNEAEVMRRCLQSVVDHIDHWVINCNGSDETADVVHELLGHLPGEILSDPWRNFAHNRSLVARAAQGRADYQFCIDADEELRVEGRLAEHIDERLDMINYWLYYSERWAIERAAILRDRLNWRFESVVHNYPAAPDIRTRGTADNIHVWHHTDGERWKNKEAKYQRNARLLEEQLAGDPGRLRNRYQFYLGESYRDCGQRDRALDAYRKRVALGGWEEEVYWSLFQIARLTGKVRDYLAAHEYRPSRAEALFELAALYRKRGDYSSAWEYCSRVARQKPDDVLFVDRTIYDWRLWDTLAACGYYVGHDPRELRRWALRALENAPASQRERMQRNLEYYGAGSH